MSVVPETMRAARMHDVGAPMVIEDVPTPRPAPLDVLVRVRACGIVPNLGNVLKNWTTRSEARSGGKACVNTCRSRWTPSHRKKNKSQKKKSVLHTAKKI